MARKISPKSKSTLKIKPNQPEKSDPKNLQKPKRISK
jgi:hypothetical protein